jgi:hypothetical protein
MHRQDVDDVGPVVAMSVPVSEQLRGDRVPVGLVVDQDAAEVVAGAVVTGTWPNGAIGTCTTNTTGTCRINRKLAKSRASIVFTVTKITAGVGP